MFGKKQSAEPAKVTSTSLAEESAKIIDVFEKAVTNLKEVASRAQAEKEVREQEIIELQTEAANLEAVSNKATFSVRKNSLRKFSPRQSTALSGLCTKSRAPSSSASRVVLAPSIVSVLAIITLAGILYFRRVLLPNVRLLPP